MLLRILVVARHPPLLRRVRRAVSREAALVTAVRRPETLWEDLAQQTPDFVLLRRADVPELSDALVAEIRALPEQPEVIVLAESEDPQERAALLAAGCLAVVYEGLAEESFARTLRALLERRPAPAVRRVDAGEPVPFRLSDYASASPAMRRFLASAQRVVRTDSTLLLLGETGVGKEWLARAVHAEGPRSGQPFVAVNCGALPETLLESELFGHERGAFTGATRARRGYFELAHRGTIFLDEIADLPLHLQVKLLQALEQRRIQPIGAEKGVAIDVRVIAATNRDLEGEVRAGRFRPDLFYRLNVVSLTLPPLRERPEDIPQLVHSYVEHFAARLRRGVRGIRPDALEALVRYSWPGNVRELINVIERAVLMGAEPEIGPGDLPEPIRRAVGAAPAAAAAPELGIPRRDWDGKPWREVRREVLAAAERLYLRALLERCQGRLWEVAERAGLDPRSLFEKMRRHGLRKEEFRAPPRGAPRPAAEERRRGAGPA